MALLGGADVDGDIICLTNQKEIIEGSYGGLPVMYETRKAPKCKIIESELYKVDLKGFNTKVGFLTNLSTTMYAMLPKFQEDSKEHNEILRRLKQCRKEQGSIIDATKGLDIKPIPTHWTNWTKITDNMSEKELEIANFNNSILIDKRPQFMQHLYPNYGKEYRQYCIDYDLLAQAKFKLFLDELLAKDFSKIDNEQKIFVEEFYKYNPLLNTPCEVNNISNYMQKKIKEISVNTKLLWSKEMIEPMKKQNIGSWDDKKADTIISLHNKYKSGKRSFGSINNQDGGRLQTIEQYNKAIRQEALRVSDNLGELAYYAIAICYISLEHDNKDFCWSVFSEGIIENLINNTKEKIFEIPFLDDDGDIEYLGKKYKRKEIKIHAEEEYGFL